MIKENEIYLEHLLSLAIKLHSEIKGIKGHYKPTAYIQIKKELGITGSRKRVLEQLGKIIEEYHGRSNR